MMRGIKTDNRKSRLFSCGEKGVTGEAFQVTVELTLLAFIPSGTGKGSRFVNTIEVGLNSIDLSPLVYLTLENVFSTLAVSKLKERGTPVSGYLTVSKAGGTSR